MAKDDRARVEDDESVRIAIKALGDMRNSKPVISSSTQQQHQQHQYYPHPTQLPPALPPHHQLNHKAFPQQTPALSVSSSSPTSSSVSLSVGSSQDAEYQQAQHQQQPPQLISKVARLPLVQGALSYYEKGKASSSVVKVCALFISFQKWFR
jgi:hypothetical protein